MLETLGLTTKQDEENEKLAGWVQAQHRLCKSNRAPLERQWTLNLAFFMGRQWTQIMSTAASTNGYRLFTPPAPPWRVRLVINKIRPIIRTELAKLTAQKPNATVQPRTTEEEDMVAARVGEQIFKSEYDEKEVHEVVKSALWWTLITGTGFSKDWWDPSALDRLGHKGDLKVEAISPYHIFVPDLRVEDIEKQPYVIHASTLPIEMARARYGPDISANVTGTTDILGDAFLTFVGQQQPSQKNEVLILECWVKPGWHPIMKAGGFVTVVGDRVVARMNSWPYKHKEYPFSKIIHIPAGRFYGISVVEDLIPLQKELNRSRSQIVESKNRMSKPQLIAPKGSVNAARITSEPGQLIEYVPGLGAPTPLPLQGLPAYVTEELMRIQNDIDDISGQHEISRGGTPSQVTAATAISYLQEQDDSKLSHTVSSIEAAIRKLGRHMLSHASQFWTEGRLVKIMGEDGSFDAKQYKGADLKGNNDLIVEAGSALPSSKAARQAFVMDLLKLGLIPPEKGLQVLDIGGMEKVYSDFLIDQRQIQRENLQLVKLDPAVFMQKLKEKEAMQNQGAPIETGAEAHDWDNHPMHLLLHNNFRKTQQFENLPPEQKMVFAAHVMYHQIEIQNQQNQAMQQQMMGVQPPEQNAQPEQNGGQPGAGQEQLAAGGQNG